MSIYLNSVSSVILQAVVGANGSTPTVSVSDIKLADGAGTDGTQKITLKVKVAGLKSGDYSIYLGDTKRTVGEGVSPGKTEWIQGEKTKTFTAEELAAGVDLTAWCAKGPKIMTVADSTSDKVVAPSIKIMVK